MLNLQCKVDLTYHQMPTEPLYCSPMCEKYNSAATKVSEEGREGGAPDAVTEIPLQPVRKTVVRQAVPLQLTEVADIHLQSVDCEIR